MRNLALFVQLIGQNLRDMLPIMAVILVFQLLVIQEPFTNASRLLGGAILVLVGLSLFMRGMTMSLFPIGESLVGNLAERANLWLLLSFGFAIGFASTIAEPALIAVTQQVAEATVAGSDAADQALLLRLICSAAVGGAVMVGCVFIVRGWPVFRLVLAGYGLAAVLAMLGDHSLNAVAFDAGAAATSAINIPLISAIGWGLATLIRGRSPVVDGFGLVSLCSVAPALAVLVLTSFF